MELRTKCQIAEMIGDGIDEHGIKPRTKPYVWMASVLGPVFERSLPMSSVTRQERQAGTGALGLLLPILSVLFVFALPIEWWRARRTTRHNAKMNRLLQALQSAAGASPGGVYRDAPQPQVDADAADQLEALRTAERLLAVDYRIESQARPHLVGTGLVAFAGERRALLWFNVHRSVPRKESTDGQALRSRLGKAVDHPVEHACWVWQSGDPYELAERESRPW